MWKDALTLLGADCSGEYYDTGYYTDSSGTVYTELPPFARILWDSRPEPGSLIHSAIWLPEHWNGVLICQGTGGLGSSYPDMAPLMREGYAAATTDLGTGRGDASGVGCPAVWRDFGWRATHLLAVRAKELVCAAYGKAADHVYFCGGSTGGQQGLMSAQRFPQDFDAILCGAPAYNRVRLHAYFLWSFRCCHDKDGRPLFTPKDAKQIHTAVLEYHRARGLSQPDQDWIPLPDDSVEHVSEVMAALRASLHDLSAAQLEGLERVYTGPIDPRTGEKVSHGLPMGAELSPFGLVEMGGFEASPMDFPLRWGMGMDFDPAAFDFGGDLDRVLKTVAPELDADSPDLSRFFAKGGKLLVTAGTEDAIVPMPDTVRYCRKAAQGGSLRLFIAPGKDHDIAGHRPDTITGEDGQSLLEVLRRWYEQGVPPETLLTRPSREAWWIPVQPLIK